MNPAKEIINSLTHIFFPHLCVGCGTDLISQEQLLCLECLGELPVTDFQLYDKNPIEKIFWGRAAITAASSHYYFTKNSILQHILHEFKYKSKKQIGIYFGRLMGTALSESNRFTGIHALIPLPLFPSKEKQRGYNQSTVLCEGISSVMKIPVMTNCIARVAETETQTKKNRIERWQNIGGKFKLTGKENVQNKHVLLVDDVLTTGATLDACANELLQDENVRVSIVTLAYAI